MHLHRRCVYGSQGVTGSSICSCVVEASLGNVFVIIFEIVQRFIFLNIHLNQNHSRRVMAF